MTQTNQEHAQQRDIKQVLETTCCIVGGGPAGAMLALLLARKGVPVILLEAHMNFDRDFRGDTIHPSTMNIMDELGLADRLLQIRHTQLSKGSLQTPTGTIEIVDISRLKTKFPYITLMAQSQFLDFLTNEAKQYPHFQLILGAQVDELLEREGQIYGVGFQGQDGRYEIHAALTVAADGRFSRIRHLAGFEPVKTSPAIDVLWFRLPRLESDRVENLGGHVGNGIILVVFNRFDYWQVGYVIPKGQYQGIKSAGLEQLREKIAKILPEFQDRVDTLKEWKQISVLSVESSRLKRWYRPGLLLIGDAAHVMSPVGGLGINYAIQDAVATANILTDKLKNGTLQTKDLAKVQRRRMLPTQIIQRVQVTLQKRALGSALGADKTVSIPTWLRMVLRIQFIRSIPARLFAFGPLPEHLKQ